MPAEPAVQGAIRRGGWLVRALALVALLLAFIAAALAVLGFNWLRGPIERAVLAGTGRALVIGGDLRLDLGWHAPRVRAEKIAFANPPWAREAQMFTAEGIDFAPRLGALLRRRLVIADLRLEQPVLILERASDGRRNWLLDRDQSDEQARIQIQRLTLDRGRIGYEDRAGRISLMGELSSTEVAGASGVRFGVAGTFRGLSLKARGEGGAVLGLRDQALPYRLRVAGGVGPTEFSLDGSVTGLIAWTAADFRFTLRGENLDALYAILGLPFPSTRAYTVSARLVHAGKLWRLTDFAGRAGASDFAGDFEVDTGAARPRIVANLRSALLDTADLDRMIGGRGGAVARGAPPAGASADHTAPRAPGQVRVLPELPFDTRRWSGTDADVRLTAARLRHPAALPLDDLALHMTLNNAVLRLDPIAFGISGGRLAGTIELDGREASIRARARLRATKVPLAVLWPAAGPAKPGAAEIGGTIDLAGQGGSVARMLGGAAGRVGLSLSNGEISKLALEKAGVHLWEILAIHLGGDRLVRVRCGAADFAVVGGLMTAQNLMVDTDITTIVGSGSIDLSGETLDLTFRPETKTSSPLALRAPILVRGTFARPEVDVDRKALALRAAGAIALGIVNPLLALIPLQDPGPGRDRDCAPAAGAERALPRAPHRLGERAAQKHGPPIPGAGRGPGPTSGAGEPPKGVGQAR